VNNTENQVGVVGWKRAARWLGGKKKQTVLGS
jgi:hypothetical protein